jgi:hypothetical protein
MLRLGVQPLEVSCSRAVIAFARNLSAREASNHCRSSRFTAAPSVKSFSIARFIGSGCEAQIPR